MLVQTRSMAGVTSCMLSHQSNSLVVSTKMLSSSGTSPRLLTADGLVAGQCAVPGVARQDIEQRADGGACVGEPNRDTGRCRAPGKDRRGQVSDERDRQDAREHNPGGQ